MVNPNDPGTQGTPAPGANHNPMNADPKKKQNEFIDDSSTRLKEETELSEEEKEEFTEPVDFEKFNVDKVDDLEKVKDEGTAKTDEEKNNE